MAKKANRVGTDGDATKLHNHMVDVERTCLQLLKLARGLVVFTTKPSDEQLKQAKALVKKVRATIKEYDWKYANRPVTDGLKEIVAAIDKHSPVVVLTPTQELAEIAKKVKAKKAAIARTEATLKKQKEELAALTSK